MMNFNLSESNRKFVLVGGFFLIGFGTGAASGYYFAKGKFQAIADAEIAEMKEHYTIINKIGAEDPEVLAQKYTQDVDGDVAKNEKLIVNYVTREEAEEEELDVVAETQTVEENIFRGSDEPDDDFDIQAEAENRDPEIPYVIHHDEYMENSLDHTQMVLTWYEQDGALADDKDVPIDEIESTVGFDNLERFGSGSRDRNVVYVRNERMEHDFEILRSEGSFAKDVLGFDDSLQHSDRVKVRKMRAYHE